METKQLESFPLDDESIKVDKKTADSITKSVVKKLGINKVKLMGILPSK